PWSQSPMERKPRFRAATAWLNQARHHFLVCAYYLALARTHLQGQVRSFLPFVFNQASLSYHLE
ncbi:MAG: hypothetical protein BRC45_03575, partial [Cyanobacteria bacterium QS_5_48_63]